MDELPAFIQRHIIAREMVVRAEMKAEMNDRFRLLDEKYERIDAQLQQLVPNYSTVQRCQV